ncbi:hypothetical protein GCM10023080_070140 [Streptomyces pseudoechinosporeus]
MIVTIIVACEIGFWAVILLGLIVRYVLRMQRASNVLLACVPLVDLVLVAATVEDLRRGTTAGFEHGLAAVYLGFTLAWGHYLIRWADGKFAHRFAGAEAPAPPPKYGSKRATHEWNLFLKTLIAGALSAGFIQLMIVGVDDPARTAELPQWREWLSSVVGVHAMVALAYTVFPKKEPKGTSGSKEMSGGKRRSSW